MPLGNITDDDVSGADVPFDPTLYCVTTAAGVMEQKTEFTLEYDPKYITPLDDTRGSVDTVCPDPMLYFHKSDPFDVDTQ